ncbi:hypothetical protein TKK_0007514 [Trichogramma kaykai]
MIFLNSEAKPKNWAKVKTLKDSKNSYKIPGRIKMEMNLVQNQKKRRLEVDEDLENIVNLYRTQLTPTVKEKSDSEIKLREKELLLKQFELLMKFHERRKENWPQDVQDAFEMLSRADTSNRPSFGLPQRPSIKPCQKTMPWKPEIERLLDASQPSHVSLQQPIMLIEATLPETTREDPKKVSVADNSIKQITDDHDLDSEHEEAPLVKKTKIADIFLKNRSQTSCSNDTIYPPNVGPQAREFTASEKRLILQSLEKHLKKVPVSSWDAIAKSLPNRNDTQMGKYARNIIQRDSILILMRDSGKVLSKEDIEWHKKHYGEEEKGERKKAKKYKKIN